MNDQSTTKSWIIRRPDDWHVHLRDGAMLRAVAPHTARQFGRAIVMPNLAPPVVNGAQARAYRERILEAVGPNADFEPLMTLYLTDETSPEAIATAFEAGDAAAVKLYPAGATTNSASGVTHIERVMPALEKMAELGMPLLVHGEVTASEVDIFDREARFIDDVLVPLRRRLPELKVVLEHITTSQAASLVTEHGGPTLGATITAHHLYLNRTDLFRGGLRPHHYCLPVAKREQHRQALRRAATSGHPAFFLGTDSAPHTRDRKECAAGCAGIYTAASALELYIQVFDEEGALDHFEAFASLHGPRFYGLAPNEARVRLDRSEPIEIPPVRAEGDIEVEAFAAPTPVRWTYGGVVSDPASAL